MDRVEKMSLIFNKLSKESQYHILSMANMAKIAEAGVLKRFDENKVEKIVQQ
ncbi:hypothetical protein [Clostridium ihumii]|uniref:hypothetical protein n=1 Tax=Clostridium ihumii TaxID=1470356 RepID=UPI000A57AFCC|nr:hypothetical protein [Clostridium ihumii]